MSPWIRSFFIQTVPKLLLMRVPKDLLTELASNKISTSGRNLILKQREMDTIPSTASSSTSSSTSSRNRAGCNGLHSTSTTNRLRGFAGVLSSRLRYNGLPSVFSGLDESDSGNRRKYPFELEKAIHNVMFIQHHIQRQDQFNAEDQDWGFVAMVLDRLFLWMFIIASLTGTFLILCEAPALYDDTKPIDMELSSVAQQQFLPELDY